jgi:D-serine deaminase-like pyridoxal phosphate-dependent protein
MADSVETRAGAAAAAMLADGYERVRREYGAAIGRPRSELVTPALVLDLPAAKRNIARMSDRIRELPAEIRPHIKVHKSPELARLQVAAGAIGLSAATVWEAIVLVRSGLEHILLVNTVAGPAKIRAVAELARETDLLIAVDDPANIDELAAATRAVGSRLGVLVEVDTGMDRAGADSVEEAVELGRRVARSPSLDLLGVTGYEGHCSNTPDHDERLVKERSAMGFLVEVATAFEHDGLACPIRSAGGTATWDWTAAFPGITEIQAGTYVVMDNFHGAMVGGFEHSLTVQATVVSRRPDRVILDAGNKSVGAGDIASIRGHPLVPFRFDEEHGIFDASAGSTLKLGDVVDVIPGYSPSTVNWFDAFHVVEDEVVVDIWPVIPRGPGHHGLVAH